MGYYPVVSLPRGGKRHIQGVPHNTCGQLNGRSAWQFSMSWGAHPTLRSAIDGNPVNLGANCKACRRNAERAIQESCD